MNNSFTIKKFPAVRIASAGMLNAASRKNMIHAFAEADVTDVRRAIRRMRQSVKKYLSLIGYIQYCAAKTVEKQKQIQAYRDFRNRLVIFDDVDISTTIERKIGGINKKPVKTNESIEEREFLCLTVSVHHDIIDGAPAAQFIRQFLRILETEITKTKSHDRNKTHRTNQKNRQSVLN